MLEKWKKPVWRGSCGANFGAIETKKEGFQLF